jgi:hypothetical protein
LIGDNGYARSGAEDTRFSDHYGSLQSIVTSSGQNDSGMFETNLRDERFLPFEGGGAISTWRIELPNEFRQFDYNTITDVILHLRYTAREGGDILKQGAVANLSNCIKEAQAAGTVRLFSIRHEFPTEWAKFKAVEIKGNVKTAELALDLRNEHYPFWSQGRLGNIGPVALFAKINKDLRIYSQADGNENNENIDTLTTPLGELRWGSLEKNKPGSPTGPLALYFDDNSMEDLYLAVTWGK